MDSRRTFWLRSAPDWLGQPLSARRRRRPRPSAGDRGFLVKGAHAAATSARSQGQDHAALQEPGGLPNGIAVAPEGLWICEQVSNNAVLVDWKGKLLKTVKTEAKNASGIGYGDGYVWMAGNSAAAEGIFQTDMSGKTVSHHQIPLGPADNGGGCHGAAYVNGKIYIAALRLKGILRVDAKTFAPEFMIPYSVNRAHGIA